MINLRKRVLALLLVSLIIMITHNVIASSQSLGYGAKATPITNATTTAYTATNTSKTLNITTVTVVSTYTSVAFVTTTIPVFFSYTSTSVVTVVVGLEPRLAIAISALLLIIALTVGYILGLKTRKEVTASLQPQPKPVKRGRR